MITSLSLKTKLLGLCGILAALTGLVGGLGFFTAREVTKLYEHVAEVNLPNATVLGEMESNFALIHVKLATLGAEGATKLSIENSNQELSALIKKYMDHDEEYNRIPFVSGEQELYDEVSSEFTKAKELSRRIALLSQSREAGDREIMLQL